MRTQFFAFVAVAAALAFSTCEALAQAVPTVYTPPVSTVGGAVASGIAQTLIKRGFAANDPRIFATIESVGARVIPLAAQVGAGANWLGVAARLSPWVLGGVLVYQGLKWYFNQDGTVTIKKDPTTVGSSGVKAGQACFYVMGGTYCAGSPEEAITSYIINKTTYTDLTSITMTAEPAGTSAYTSGRRYYPVNIAGHRVGDTVTIWTNPSSYSIYTETATIDCPGNFVQNGTVCVPGQLAKFVPSTTTDTATSLQAAYDKLTEAQKQAAASQELFAEIANRLWRDAAAQPGYKGVPWSRDRPVGSPDFDPYVKDHPEAWPRNSDLSKPVPTTKPVVLPEDNPNATNPDPNATKIDLGDDPGVPAPELEDTPTDLFQPIKALLDPWVNWTVPSHSAQCPTWAAQPSIAGHVFYLDVSAHCDLAEQYRSLIVAASLAAWLAVAAFIVLSA